MLSVIRVEGVGVNRYKLRELPIVSIVLVAANVIVFLISQFVDGLYLLGGVSVPEVVVNREYGRIVWAMFLHADQYHIFNNMLILAFLGAMIEREVGHISYACIYFLSGIGGNIISLYMKYLSGDMTYSIGASGAVFGLDGVLIAMVLFAGRRLPTVTPMRVVVMVLLSLYSGFTANNIDNAAHVGGLIAGFLSGSILCLIQRRKGGNEE